MDGEAKEKRLTGKQQAFIIAYLGKARFNGTEAARQAGYKQPHPEGSRLLQNATVREAIAAYWNERAMPAEEVTARLSEQARASIEDFIEILPGGDWRLDLQKAQAVGKMHLIHKLSYDRNEKPAIELYDAQAAQVHVGKIHKLFVERKEVTGANGGPVEVKAVDYRTAIAALAPGPVDDSAASGED